MNPSIFDSKKRPSQNDGFAMDVNITQYKEKYRMEPPKLISKPPPKFYEVQEQFMQRGFMEMKDVIQKRVQEHIKLAKRMQYHKVKCDIELESVEIEPVTLYTVHGEQIKSFKHISPDCKIIIVSLDGIFRGLHNTLRPKETVKQRIIKEKETRNTFNMIKSEFSKSIGVPKIRPSTKSMSNSRKKINSKQIEALDSRVEVRM